MDVIERIFALRRASEHAVVSEAGRTELQERLHVEDDIERWLIDRIQAATAGSARQSSLFVLSGNAGDGKSDLLARLEDRIDLTSCEVIRDATQSDDPDQDQIERLASFFRPFADEAAEGKPVHLIAMNTGMAISFFDGVGRRPDLGTFTTLNAVVSRELGLSRGAACDPPPWDFEVINLDRRDLLDEGFLFRMLDRLDPENADGLFHDAGERCVECANDHVCFVRTNLALLRDGQVRAGVRESLRAASLERGVHFSPRNLWDGLSWFIGGDPGFFGETSPSCAALATAAERPEAELLAGVHRRLLWHSLFARADDPGRSRSLALDAMRSADPVPRASRNCHDEEALIYAGPRSEQERFRELAGTFCSGGDAVLAHLADRLGDPAVFQALRADLLLGVARRAAVLRSPAQTYRELEDEDLRDFSEILDAYAEWRSDGTADQLLIDFTRTTLRDGVASVFGVRVSNEIYFGLSAFAPTTSYPAYVKVNMDRIVPVPDEDVDRDRDWLRALRYRPSKIVAEVRSAGEGASRFHVDLPLFRLLRRVAVGYSASSLDLEAFYALRFACERLGAAGADGGQMVLRETNTGFFYRAAAENIMGQEGFRFEVVQ